MVFRLLNLDFIDIHVIDIYSSFIWTERYIGYGDFELVVPPSIENLELIKENFYIWTNESDKVMIVEDIRIQTDVEIGNRLVVTGRSLESILLRRITWSDSILTGNFQAGIRQLITNNILTGANANRRIANFIFENSTDTSVTNIIFEEPVDVPVGLTLYEKIKELCYERDIGFKIILDNRNRFVFSLYFGIDRSYNQKYLPYVIFSPHFDNLFNSNFFLSIRDLRTVSWVGGENPREEHRNRVFTEVLGANSGSGIFRREKWIDASSLSSNYGREEAIPPSTYLELLRERGKNALSEATKHTAFEGGIDIDGMFVFNKDFFMGDIVQVQNEFGIERPSRITELVRSLTKSGVEAVPTFVTIEK